MMSASTNKQNSDNIKIEAIQSTNVFFGPKDTSGLSLD